MKEYKPQEHNRLFNGFVLTYPRHKSLFHSWKDAQELGLPNEFELGERLFSLMVETGYYNLNEPE